MEIPADHYYLVQRLTQGKSRQQAAPEPTSGN